MKKLFPALAGLLLFFASCKEKAPLINFANIIVVDTTFLLPASEVPATDPHNVLVEEYTGASCVNCPDAHETLTELSHSHPGRINAFGLYIYGPFQTKPPVGAKYDFRDSTALEIANSIYLGVNILPIAGIDRTPVGGKLQLDKGLWNITVENQLNIVDSLNLKVESEYNTTTGDAAIRATVTYTHPINYPHNLTIVVVEDSIIDKQEYNGGVYDEYVFTNVFRGMVTAVPFGDPVLASIPVKEMGRVLIRNYVYKPRKVLDPAKCRVIAFINSTNGDHRVLQSTQSRLK